MIIGLYFYKYSPNFCEIKNFFKEIFSKYTTVLTWVNQNSVNVFGELCSFIIKLPELVPVKPNVCNKTVSISKVRTNQPIGLTLTHKFFIYNFI